MLTDSYPAIVKANSTRPHRSFPSSTATAANADPLRASVERDLETEDQ